MATFGDMKTAIARRLVDESNTAVTLVEIGEAINDAINFWKQRRFWFNSTASALAISAADTEVTLPSDFLIDQPRNAFTVTESGYNNPVHKVSPTIFDAMKNTASTGRPKYYCYRDGALQFIPTANIDYAGMLYYVKDYTDFTTGTSQDTLSNDWTAADKGERLIRNEALARLHGELRQDEKMEMVYQNKTAREYSNLVSRTNQLLKTGTLTTEH